LIDLKADLEGSKDLRDLPLERSNSAKFLTRTMPEQLFIVTRTKSYELVPVRLS